MVTMAISMPVFNERATVLSFIDGLEAAAKPFNLSICVVDDCSTDGSFQFLSELSVLRPNLVITQNDTNKGHGPTTLKALRLALSTDAAVIISSDGDGQVNESDLIALGKLALERNVVVEGVRVRRGGPWFRKVTSWFTRRLVHFRSGTSALDANTPFRAYPRELIERLLEEVPSESLTPNMLISVLTRRSSHPFVEIPVREIFRNGSHEFGATWGQTSSLVPSRTFLRFLQKALIEWFRSARP